jgi:hypothetical protein
MSRQIKGWVEPKDLCSWSTGNGHLEVLKWARVNGSPWDKSTCSEVAKNGHLQVLQWARANECPWNELTCAAAANGHLEVLQWVRANFGININTSWVSGVGCSLGLQSVYRSISNRCQGCQGIISKLNRAH